ncbi:MAG TPA: HAD family hydrolase [Polyangiales bacterium]|nr:HAD family hydrolase [Polyangiales bacterium]
MGKAVFFDRDGVINVPMVRDGLPFAPKDMSEFAFMEGAHETLNALKARGYVLLVVTNQPDVARGWQAIEQVEEFHRHIEAELPVSRIYACFHDNAHACECRKPKPGMLIQGSREFDIDLTQSFLVGDRWKDIEAGRSAGCKTIYLRHGYDEAEAHSPDYEIKGLPELLAIIR